MHDGGFRVTDEECVVLPVEVGGRGAHFRVLTHEYVGCGFRLFA